MFLKLKIFYSKYKELIIKNSLNNNEFLQTYSPNEYRFKNRSNTIIYINPPSCTIHVSNLKKKACTFDYILQLFSPYGKILKIKYDLNQI